MAIASKAFAVRHLTGLGYTIPLLFPPHCLITPPACPAWCSQSASLPSLSIPFCSVLYPSSFSLSFYPIIHTNHLSVQHVDRSHLLISFAHPLFLSYSHRYVLVHSSLTSCLSSNFSLLSLSVFDPTGDRGTLSRAHLHFCSFDMQAHSVGEEM